MGQTANEIETEIENTRQDLASNLRQLEHKVKAVTDWKQHFRNNPMTAVGIAMGGGIVLAAMMSGQKGRRPHRPSSLDGKGDSYRGTPRPLNQAMETWNNIKGALVGVAATRFTNFVAEVVPGFHDEYHRTQREKSSSSATENGRDPGQYRI